MIQKQTDFISGNQLVAEAAIAAGCTFYAGYPITPSSEVAERMALLLPRVDGKFIQMEDEISSMGAIIGASLAGKKTMTATSGPGVSLMLENLGFGYMAEVPCVIVNVMRGGPSTGLPTTLAQADVMQAKYGTHGDHPCIAIAPAYLKEIFLCTIKAFNYSEKYRIPVLLLLDEVIGHLSSNTSLPYPDEYDIVNRPKPTVPPEEYSPYDISNGDVPPMANFFEGYRYHVTGLSHDKTGFPTTDPDFVNSEAIRQERKIQANIRDIEQFEFYQMDDAEIGIFAFGSAARGAVDAINMARAEGIKVGLLRAITVWPFPKDQVLQMTEKVKAIIVTEFNMGQLLTEVKAVVAGKKPVYDLNRVGGVTIPPTEILAKIKEVNNGI